jgi:hypothetical protein
VATTFHQQLLPQPSQDNPAVRVEGANRSCYSSRMGTRSDTVRYLSTPGDAILTPG